MAKKYSDLRMKMPATERAEVDKRVQEELARMPLYRIRRARQLTQKQLADLLEIDQPSVSKLERRTDMYVSTLRNFVEAMNGRIEIKAVFPEGEYEIVQFGDDVPPGNITRR